MELFDINNKKFETIGVRVCWEYDQEIRLDEVIEDPRRALYKIIVRTKYGQYEMYEDCELDFDDEKWQTSRDAHSNLRINSDSDEGYQALKKLCKEELKMDMSWEFDELIQEILDAADECLKEKDVPAEAELEEFDKKVALHEAS